MLSPKDILKKVRQIEIRSRRQVTDALSGAYHSVFKGKGMNFEEVREYAPGDDVRAIDWNVTAKMEKPFIKVFREERELTIVLAVDLSGSSDFGSRAQTKRELSAELASVLAFSAARNNDKVGLLLFTDKVEQYIPPKKGRQHILRVIREMLFFEPTGKGTDIAAGLRYLNHLQKRQAIVFLFSDFICKETQGWSQVNARNDDTLSKVLAITNRRHDLVCIETRDQRESQLPATGLLLLEDAETGEVVEVDAGSKRVRALFEKANKERQEALVRVFRQLGLDHLVLETGASYEATLRAFFSKRKGRR